MASREKEEEILSKEEHYWRKQGDERSREFTDLRGNLRTHRPRLSNIRDRAEGRHTC